ncbi:MAG: zf-HC2 domain-containing protein, partial [Planctomycetaceae bacterium]|nr:zf-HC2 domain-containing protein [Planctomycetaceae bacterium]
MNCITAKNHLSAYCDGELSAQLASQVRDHIAGCTDCSDELASFNKLSAMFAASSVPEPPATLWSNIESAMTTSPEKQRVTINRPVGVSPRVLRLALAASLLLVLGIWRTSVWQSNDHRQHDELAVNLRELMSEFSSEPLLAMNKLSEQYRGVEVSLDGAENLLGYRPAIGKNLPSGYQLTSTR